MTQTTEMKQSEVSAASSQLPEKLAEAVRETEHRIAVALGEVPPDLVLKGGHVVDVYLNRVWEADIAIAGSRIAGVRPDLDPLGAPVLDCRGLIAGPGFVEPHMHIETTFVSPRQLSRAIVPTGTTTLFADGTDASYVGGTRSVDALFSSTSVLPMRVFLAAPSYSAYLPGIQTVGGLVDLQASREMLEWPQTVSLGEVVAAKVVARDPEYLAKVSAYLQAGKRINGHSADGRGDFLDAFVGAGVIDDHTAWSGESIEDRLARGVTLFLVEAPGRRRISRMLQHVIAKELPTRMLCLCIDNTSIVDIVRDGYGYLDYPVRLAVEAGMPPVEAIQMATLNPASYYGRDAHFGSLAPGRYADIQLWEDLSNFRPRYVLFEGKVVAEDGKMTAEMPPSEFPSWYLNTVQLHESLQLDRIFPTAPTDGDHVRARLIQLDAQDPQAANLESAAELPVKDGKVWPAPERNIASFCVVERYGLNGNIGYGYLEGSGLQRGALATSVSISDSNIVVMGCDPVSMWTAIKAIEEMQGGFVVTEGEKVLASLRAPVGGQMSDEPFEEVLEGFNRLQSAAKQLGTTLSSPFQMMASTVLMSVPALGLSDGGYIDAQQGTIVSTFLDSESG